MYTCPFSLHDDCLFLTLHSVLGRSENGEWVVSELAEGKTKPGEEEKEEEEEEEEEEEAEKMIQGSLMAVSGPVQ